MKYLVLFIFLISSVASFAKNSGYLFISSKLSPNKKWIEFSKEERLSIKHLLENLAKSTTGRELIREANKKVKVYGKTLYDVILAGKGSITDTTLIRRFTPSKPEQIDYESRSTVYLNKYLNEYDGLLDLAHELTHFVYRKGFNPYAKNFSLADFISNTIEEEGGEVHAFITECKVLDELFPKQLVNRYNCKKIMDPNTGKLSREMAIKKFYSVGPYYSKYKHKLDTHGITNSFPYVTQDEVTFVSSAYGMPYPVAAYHEYVTVLGKVCENDKKRLSYLDQESGDGRKPASLTVSKAKQDYLDRCSSVN